MSTPTDEGEMEEQQSHLAILFRDNNLWKFGPYSKAVALEAVTRFNAGGKDDVSVQLTDDLAVMRGEIRAVNATEIEPDDE